MRILSTCESCGSDKVMLEFRDSHFENYPLPREAYGTWLVCTKCGYQWPEDNEEFLYVE